MQTYQLIAHIDDYKFSRKFVKNVRIVIESASEELAISKFISTLKNWEKLLNIEIFEYDNDFELTTEIY